MSDSIQTTITSAEAARRRAIVEDARHSSALEGGRSSDQVHAAQDRWVAGEISYGELGDMVRELHPTTAPR
ncbi:antitoxin VbhA family protein [Microbacterium sp. IO18]|uniref:antitoxin VbhA family protein n=1 Tax=Microbacterium sp. IO18 TaxID=3390997 RepID=UPI003B9EDB2F